MSALQRHLGAKPAMQLRIDAQQAHDAIDYALRSIRTCGGSTFCVGVHAAQLARGIAAAASIGYLVATEAGGWGKPDRQAAGLREAKAEAAELLKLAKADIKAIGGQKQLRLALGIETAHEYALAA